MVHLVQMKVVPGKINLQFCGCANAQMLLLPYSPKFSKSEATGQNSTLFWLLLMQSSMMRLSIIKPWRQTHFYPELNFYVGFGSLLCTKSEAGCEGDTVHHKQMQLLWHATWWGPWLCWNLARQLHHLLFCKYAINMTLHKPSCSCTTVFTGFYSLLGHQADNDMQVPCALSGQLHTAVCLSGAG